MVDPGPTMIDHAEWGGQVDRHLDWPGVFNVRDLGGLPAGAARTRRAAVVRADDLDHLTPAGWDALWAYGVRTIVDLRNDDELGRRTGAAGGRSLLGATGDLPVPRSLGDARPAGLTTVHVPLDDVEDTGMWRHFAEAELDGSPLYYRPFLERKPERCAAAVRAVARAAPGGVVVHCGAGRDRTGLVALLLLALVGVAPAEIAADYALSAARLPPLYLRDGIGDQNAEVDRILRHRGTTVEAEVLATLEGFDPAGHLRAVGLDADDLAAVRARLLEPAPAAPSPVGRGSC